MMVTTCIVVFMDMYTGISLPPFTPHLAGFGYKPFQVWLVFSHSHKNVLCSSYLRFVIPFGFVDWWQFFVCDSSDEQFKFSSHVHFLLLRNISKWEFGIILNAFLLIWKIKHIFEYLKFQTLNCKHWKHRRTSDDQAKNHVSPPQC